MKKRIAIILLALCALLVILPLSGCTSSNQTYEYVQPNGTVCAVTIDWKNNTATYSGTSITWMFLKGWSYAYTAKVGLTETVTGTLTLERENFAGAGNHLYHFTVTEVPDHITKGWTINLTDCKTSVELSLNGYGTYVFRKV